MESTATDRAKAVLDQYVSRPGIIGAFLTGAGARPFSDAMSDLDIIVVYDDDAYENLAPGERVIVHFAPGPERRKLYDLIGLPKSRFEAERHSNLDHVRWGLQHGIVLHDPTGWLTTFLREVGPIPDDIREARLRAHCYEYQWGEYRAERAAARPHLSFMAGALRSTGLIGLSKALFVAAGSWPAKLQWLTHELRELSLPEDLVAELEHAFAHLDARNDKLRTLAFEWLKAKGYTFQYDTMALGIWGVEAPEGIAAIETWVRTH